MEPISILQRTRANSNTYIEIYYGNWFVSLWRPGNPTVCHLQAEEPKKLSGLKFKSPKQDIDAHRSMKMDVSSHREGEFSLLFSFCFIQAILDWRISLPIQAASGGGISLLSLLNQIVIFAATPPQIHPEGKVFTRYFGISLAQSVWRMKLAITDRNCIFSNRRDIWIP